MNEDPTISNDAVGGKQNGPVKRTEAAAVRTDVNAIIASIQHEGSGGQEPECTWSVHVYIRIYEGPAESGYGLGRSIVTMVQPPESLL
jgi:hypothetical protein